MNTPLKAILAALTVSVGLAAHADPYTASSNKSVGAEPTDALVDARNERTQAKAEYKARKKVAEAHKALDVADCKTSSLESKDMRDCTQEAKAEAKQDKRDAKAIYKEEKAEIRETVN